MCLLVIALRQHEKLPLIVAGNRDEFHARPTQNAHWWPDNPQVLGGRDLQAGGTWFAVHRNGRFATVTNHRDAQKERAGLKSRGYLITDFLASDQAPLDYLQTIDGDAYAGFNLLVVDRNAVAYLSNRGAAMRELPPGIYGLSNATLDEPWTKVTRSKSRLQALIQDDEVNESNLLRMLDDRHKAASEEVQTNSLSFSIAHALTAPFIVLPEYGTRCSTILTVSDEGRARFAERRFDALGRTTGESNYAFELGSVDGE